MIKLKYILFTMNLLSIGAMEKGQQVSTRFTFILDNQQTMQNLDHLKMIDYQRFKAVNHIGTLIQSAAKDNDWQTIEKTLDQHTTIVPFIKLEIEDAFVSALNLRNYETIKYFLENGFKINEVAEDSVLTVCYALEYLRGEDAPFELLKLILSYGANPRKACDRDSQTPLHVAAQYGDIRFMKILLQHGADINAVSDERETPLGVALRCKKQSAAVFLKERGGSQKWNL